MEHTPTTLEQVKDDRQQESHEQPGNLSARKDADTIALYGYLGVANPDIEVADAVQYIKDFYTQRGARSMGEMLLNIRDAEHRIGPAPLGIPRAIHVKNYLKTLAQIDSLVGIKEAMERVS